MTEKEKLYELIARELASENSEQEKSILDNIFQNDDDIERRFSIIHKFWNSYFPKTTSNNIIQLTEKKLGYTYHSTAKSKSGFIFRIAATILLILSLGFVGFQLIEQNKKQELKEYSCGPNEVKNITLSDGTKVWLNSSSMLIALEPFDKDFRKVTLVGEGYFEVAHNNKKPFLVKTNQLVTKVLGTHFNIIAYPGENFQEVSLYEGKVELSNEKQPTNNVIINPGEKATFQLSTENFYVVKTDLGNPAVWRDGILRFYDEELKSITKKLERKFQTKIFIADEIVGELRYTGNFDEEPLLKIIKLLNEAHEFNFQETDNGILIESI